MLERARLRFARWIAPRTRGVPARPLEPQRLPSRFTSDFALNWGRSGIAVDGESVHTRMYHAARNTRASSDMWRARDTSADTELYESLGALRSRSRQLIRDAAFAKRAKTIVVNNVVGSGIGLQAQVMTTRDVLNERVNADIEAAWARWCKADACHTGGKLHFADLERALMGQVFDAGEVFVRKHRRRFGASQVPLALELIEAERIVDEYASIATPAAVAPGARVRMGVEVDEFDRPLAYWIRRRHPGEYRVSAGESDRPERVPADEIIHLHIVDRWPQTRGEPWLHAVIRKLNDLDGYTEAELVAARGAACYLATIETESLGTPLAKKNELGEQEISLEPGLVQRLVNGEKFNFTMPNRPNVALDPFMRAMLREMAAGSQCSYESLSRDYSQSNYSSSRLALLDDRDLWRMLQLWFIRAFRETLHAEWLQQAVLARAIPAVPAEQYAFDREKFEAARYKPRGWSWIDPTKEVEAYKEAVRNGFTTQADVIAQTGGGQDIEDVLQQRERELRMAREKGLVFDIDPSVGAKSAPAASPPAADNETDAPARVVSFGAKR